ncbi:F-box/kelch-repeat protein [Arachis hypogaea]|nr:F-box/kelch-repeat protein [Arachis hypogaea]
MATHSDQIPKDLVLEILAKLPVKSLKRFSCVHKSWLNLLENSNFKSMYYENLKYKTTHSSSLLLWRYFHDERSDGDVYEYDVHLLSGERYENIVTLVLPSLFEDNGFYKVLDCVNGIICHYEEEGLDVKIGLWNPKTDQRKIIPPGITDDEPGFDRQISIHGFGYDNVNDDYKVIQCVYYIHGHTFVEEPVLTIWQIYSLKSNCWKKLDLEMTKREHIDNASVAYLNGICHWWGSEYATNGLEEEQVLVSFNLSTETFQITSIVWLQENDDSPIRSLVVLNKSVTLISSFAENNCIEISILGEVGVKESWLLPKSKKEVETETLASPPPRTSLSGTTIVVWSSVLLPPSRIAASSSSTSARQFLVFICSIALLPPSVGRSVTIVFVWSSQILPTHHCLLSCVRRLASVSVTILPPSSQAAQKKNPSPFQFPSFEFREQKLNQEKNLRL